MKLKVIRTRLKFKKKKELKLKYFDWFKNFYSCWLILSLNIFLSWWHFSVSICLRNQNALPIFLIWWHFAGHKNPKIGHRWRTSSPWPVTQSFHILWMLFRWRLQLLSWLHVFFSITTLKRQSMVSDLWIYLIKILHLINDTGWQSFKAI